MNGTGPTEAGPATDATAKQLDAASIPQAPDLPVATCRLIPPGRGHRTHWLAIVDDCPLCHCIHMHGAGENGDVLGHRLGHCTGPWSAANTAGGYVLVRGDR